MLNVRFDFGFIGRLFGVPRKFLSQIGAFCASLSSGHQIIDVQTPAFPNPEKSPVTIGINEAHLRAFIQQNATSGHSSPITVVTDVYWNGTQIVVSKATLSLSKGLVTGSAAATERTIGTVTYNP